MPYDVANVVDVAVDDVDVRVTSEAVTDALTRIVFGAFASAGDRVHAVLDVLPTGR